jgi:hypothetical protein
MNPLVVFIIQEIVKQAPGLAVELIQLFQKGDPTPEDWAALKQKVNKGYADYLAEAEKAAK